MVHQQLQSSLKDCQTLKYIVPVSHLGHTLAQSSWAHSTRLHQSVFLDRGLRKDLFGRYKKKDGSKSRSRSREPNDKGRGR